jgi:hypothetical protein
MANQQTKSTMFFQQFFISVEFAFILTKIRPAECVIRTAKKRLGVTELLY